LSFVRAVTKPGSTDPARHHTFAAKFGIPLAGLLLAVVALATIVPKDGPLLGFLACLGVMLLTVLAMAALFVVAEAKRRNTDYQISSAEFWFSPKPLRVTMRSILNSAEAIDNSKAYRDGLLDGAAIHEVVYSAAVSAVDAKRIHGGLRHLVGPGAFQLREDADRALAAIEANLKAIEADLRQAATDAIQLSTKLPMPPRPTPRTDAVASARAQERAHEEHTAAVEAVRASTQRSNARETESGHRISDAVSGLAFGYDEATKVTDHVLRGPNLQDMDKSTTQPVGSERDAPTSQQRPRGSKAVVKNVQTAVERSRSTYRKAQAARESVSGALTNARDVASRSRSTISKLTRSTKRDKTGD
jgi:hypothetical protein